MLLFSQPRQAWSGSTLISAGHPGPSTTSSSLRAPTTVRFGGIFTKTPGVPPTRKGQPPRSHSHGASRRLAPWLGGWAHDRRADARARRTARAPCLDDRPHTARGYRGCHGHDPRRRRAPHRHRVPTLRARLQSRGRGRVPELRLRVREPRLQHDRSATAGRGGVRAELLCRNGLNVAGRRQRCGGGSQHRPVQDLGRQGAQPEQPRRGHGRIRLRAPPASSCRQPAERYVRCDAEQGPPADDPSGRRDRSVAR